MKSIFLKTAVTAVLIGMTAVAFGAPPDGKGGGSGSGGGPPDGKGNKPDTEVGNNLSVPAIILGATASPFENLACDAVWTPLDPATDDGKDPLFYDDACEGGVVAAEEGDETGPYCIPEGYYFVQRVHQWQAPCALMTNVAADAAWGDNLTGTASMKVGSPIRVELVLWAAGTDAAGKLGYHVIKLQPDELDRNSEYGHLASGSEAPFGDVQYAVGTPYPVTEELGDFEGTFGAIVHDADALLKIELLDASDNPVSEVYSGDAGAEINATGKIVYGYNLRVGVAGKYRITYTLPNVTAGTVDAGTYVDTDNGAVASLDITVIGGGGGGKK